MGQARIARKCTCNATQCEFAFPPTQPTDLSLLLQAEQQRPAFDEVRLLAMRVGLPSGGRRAQAGSWSTFREGVGYDGSHGCQCSHHNTSVLGQVLIVSTRALVVFRSNLISANAPQTL